MKLLQQLFGGVLFGKSKANKTAAANGDGSSGAVVIVDNNSSDIHRKTTTSGSAAFLSATYRRTTAATEQPATPDANDNHVVFWRSFELASSVEPTCRSPPVHPRRAPASPDPIRARRPRLVSTDDDRRRQPRTEASTPNLPRSRSLIRTNPWLPPSSPKSSPYPERASPMSTTSSSTSTTAPSTPVDATDSSQPVGTAGVVPPSPPPSTDETSGCFVEDDSTTCRSEGYCSISSLCTMSDSWTPTRSGPVDDDDDNDDPLKMSVDSLSSLFASSMAVRSTGSSGIGGGYSLDDDERLQLDGSAPGDDVDRKSGARAAIPEAERIVVADVFAADEDPTVRRATTDGDQSTTISSDGSRSDVDEITELVVDAPEVDPLIDDPDIIPRADNEPPVDQPGSDDTRKNDTDRSSVVFRGGDLIVEDVDVGGTTPPPPPPRNPGQIATSLAASVERLRRDRRAVDDAFRRARAEERQRVRELANIRRRMAEARRDILLGTLRELRRELRGQCSRLQAAYDTLLAARWPHLHRPETGYATALLPTGYGAYS